MDSFPDRHRHATSTTTSSLARSVVPGDVTMARLNDTLLRCLGNVAFKQRRNDKWQKAATGTISV
jgi:hypothetical protein